MEKNEKTELSPEENLKNIAQTAEAITKDAKEILAMLEEAEERGNPVNFSDSKLLEKFGPNGHYETLLSAMHNELLQIDLNIYNQGIKMTKEDVSTRLEKMKIL